MLKLTIFALLLLNFYQISAENQKVLTNEGTNDDVIAQYNDLVAQKAASKQYFRDNWHEVEAYVWKYGGAIDRKLNDLSYLDDKFSHPHNIYRNHGQLCLEDAKFLEGNTSELSPWDASLLSEYNQFYEILNKIPNFEVDWEKLEFGLINEYGRLNKDSAAAKVSIFTQHFLCLQNLKSIEKPRKVFETLYEIYLIDKYRIALESFNLMKKHTNFVNAEGVFVVVIFVLIIVACCCCVCTDRKIRAPPPKK